DYTYDCRVWRRYFLGETLAERLALQQVIQEGNSVEGNMVFIAAFREVGDHETAEILEYINADETVHARFGNKWLLWLVDNSHAEYENTLNRVMANSGLKIPGKAPVNKYTRALSAFPMWFIEGLP
ncbi:MAG TPA: DUF455 family protein, partial [Gemmataceae bacterium]|nr:DUF455 family protein [Gemmataceae bacterium]